jgi:hypothetical protein
MLTSQYHRLMSTKVTVNARRINREIHLKKLREASFVPYHSRLVSGSAIVKVRGK